jgi:chemotaxis protein methyltransferase CheR
MNRDNNPDKDFEELKTGVKQLLGFNTFQYKDSYLGRRFHARMRSYQLDNYHAYWELLRDDKNEQERLRQDLTINVTEFFRDNTVYTAFQQDVLPKVLQSNQGKIRVWSAGSSDGKEAYSMAMIAADLLGESEVKARIEVIGTDIDKTCLERATSGIYVSRLGITQTDIRQQLRYLPTAETYFDIEGDTYKVKPFLKNLVHFEHHDLISGPKKRHFDIILCRNVVIYFNRELQEVLYMDFYQALKENGYFIMGKTETLVGAVRDVFIPYNSSERIFTKRSKSSGT